MVNHVPSQVLNPRMVHDTKNSAVVEKKTGFIAQSDKMEINWIHTFMLTVPPIIAIVGLLTTKLTLPTLILGITMYFWTGIGITGGYHRLWSHKAYSASWPVRFFLMLGGSGAFEGSIKWWSRNHRAHHRYTDTNKDPYNARRGFWYAHLGWMIQKQNAKSIGFADISDLNRDPMILWQHKYYPFVSIFIGLVLPTLIAGLWGDMWGGYFYAGVWRMVFVHHATFFVNSLAHTIGDKNFSDLHTAFDSWITALLTMGEGYHNYHHEFPQDYRNGIRPTDYDPTKWFVVFLSWFGHTYDLKYISNEEIKKAKIQMSQRDLDNQYAKAMYGKKFTELPSYSMEEMRNKVSQGEQLIVIDGIVHDVKNFVHEHPGGRQTLLNFVGTDATNLFNGHDGAHLHSKEARQFLYAMRVANIKEVSDRAH